MPKTRPKHSAYTPAPEFTRAAGIPPGAPSGTPLLGSLLGIGARVSSRATTLPLRMRAVRPSTSNKYPLRPHPLRSS